MPTTETKTVKSSGGDYSSLSAWEAAEQVDTVGADKIKQAECYTFEDTTSCTLDGWTTDATRYIRIYGVFRPTGPNTGYRIQANSFLNGITCNEDYVRVDGIGFTTGTNGFYSFLLSGAGSVVRDLRISNCWFNKGATNFGNINIVGDANTIARVWNNVFASNTTTSIVVLFNFGPIGYFYNNTVIGHAHSYSSGTLVGSEGSVVYAKNNLVDLNGATSCSAFLAYTGGSFHADSTNNLSSDTTAPGSNPVISVTPTYVNLGGLDYHLAAADAVARIGGANLSTDAAIQFNDDIDGESRDPVWSIGADQTQPNSVLLVGKTN